MWTWLLEELTDGDYCSLALIDTDEEDAPQTMAAFAL